MLVKMLTNYAVCIWQWSLSVQLLWGTAGWVNVSFEKRLFGNNKNNIVYFI